MSDQRFFLHRGFTSSVELALKNDGWSLTIFFISVGKIMAATGALTLPPSTFSRVENQKSPQFSNLHLAFRHSNYKRSGFSTASPLLSVRESHGNRASYVLACLSSPSSASPNSSTPSTKLYVSGLSFRTTEQSLRSAFNSFGELTEVNLVMDKIAKRPRGFAFLRYATEESSQKAIEGMHGKFLDGRVIFVEVAKPRSELRQGFNKAAGNITR